MSLKLSEKEAQNKLKRAASAASVALAAALTLFEGGGCGLYRFSGRFIVDD